MDTTIKSIHSVASAVEKQIANQKKLTKIIITPLESYEHNNYPRTFTQLHEANGFLFTEGCSAPEHGYYKYSVKLEWEDNTEYNLRLDLNKNKDNSLTRHFKNLFHYYLTKELPEQITKDKMFKETRNHIQNIYLNYQTYL